MTDVTVLPSVAGAVLIGAISPGPTFVVVSRIAITQSRGNGLAAALGVGVGGALFATLAIGGLTALLLQVGWLDSLLKIAGGLYLVYTAGRILAGASTPIAVEAHAPVQARSCLRSFYSSLLTHLSNPKTAVVYASIFAALLPPSPSVWLLVAIPLALFAVEAGWFALVALALSSAGPRAVYLRSKTWTDRVAGAVIGGLGVRLVFEEASAKITT